MATITVLRHAVQVAGVQPPGTTRARGAAMRRPGVIEDGALVRRDGRSSGSARPPTCRRSRPTPKIIDADRPGRPARLRGQSHAPDLRRLARGRVRAALARAHLSGDRRARRRHQRHRAPRPGRLQGGAEGARPAAAASACCDFGVTTVEVKSGYGLTTADEIKCLEAVAELNAEGPAELVPTFLGAHAVPPEYRSDRDGYLRLLLDDMLPRGRARPAGRVLRRLLRDGRLLHRGVAAHPDAGTRPRLCG